MSPEYQHFIDEPIEVIFDQPPVVPKAPPCPNAFVWQGELYRIVELLGSWQDFRHKTRVGRHMPMLKHGTWGTGRFTFEVRVEDGRIFVLYYDRVPRNANNREGNWVLVGER